jgi:hypothetical protein
MKGPVLRLKRFSTLGWTSAALAAGLSLIAAPQLRAQAKGSLSELDIENSELKVTLEKSRAALVKSEADLVKSQEDNKQLRDALAETEKTLADMRKYLAAVAGEREVFKRETSELKLRIEALGLDVSSGNNAKLEQRLLAAVSDLRITNEEKKKLSEALVRLSEAVALYTKTPSADSRLALEVQLRNANAALGLASPNAVEALPVPATISDGMAISVKDDLALVVINLGSKAGVRVGMPFLVIRGDHIVGTVRIVDVREKIAGAVIQNLTTEKDRIQVGDHVKVDAHQ